jgi:hypothetical protein
LLEELLVLALEPALELASPSLMVSVPVQKTVCRSLLIPTCTPDQK